MKVYNDDHGEWKFERTKHVSTEALYACRSKFGSKFLFVGSCSAPGATLDDKHKIEKMLLEADCIPVFQDHLPAFGAYLEFCQTFLWPVMNNQLPLEEDTEILLWNEELWKAYKSANEMFCNRVVAIVTELALTRGANNYINMWVNDFHLFLLPALLRRKLFGSNSNRSSAGNLLGLQSSTSSTPPITGLHKLTLGMYIHTPYPTSEIFLTLPVRSEIMRGLLSVDLLGFQFYDYTRHFFSGAQKLFGVKATCQKGGLLALEVSEDRNVFIHITHNCIEHEYVVEAASSRQVQRKASGLRDRFRHKVIIGSVDKLGRTSGILLKLRAFKLFLQQYTQYHNRVVLLLYMVARGPQTTSPEHRAIAGEAADLMRSINEEFGFHVEIKEQIDQSDKCALMCASDILLETSLKDGLNLVPFEYLAARDAWLKLEATLTDLSSIHTRADAPFFSQISADNLSESFEEDLFGQTLVETCRKTGRIVMSEFTGSCQVLPGALRVNPWHVDTILAALDESLTMPLHMAQSAFTRDVNYVCSQSQVNWAREFTTQIIRASITSSSTSVRRVEEILASASSEDPSVTPRSTTVGPAAYSAIPRLNRETVLHAFKKSHARIFFLDNEGTLAPNMSRIYRHYGSISMANPASQVDLQSKGSGPSDEVMRMLGTLCSDPRNIVMILSGRDRKALSKWFSPLLPVIGLAAEHGYFWTHPKISGSGSWRCLLDGSAAVEGRWIATTEEIMNRYVNRTPNTYVEDKGSARVWQFRDAEADFGPAQATELHSELEIALRNEVVDITTGKGYVEVKLRGVNKGAAVERILKSLGEERGGRNPDFILCIGDDRSDESMFEKLLHPQPSSCAVFTSTVGRKKTLAKNFLSDVEHVSTLLHVLADQE